MNYPPKYDTTSTQQGLGKGPQDMPDRGGPKPNAQTTSTQVPLTRKESPVAQFGAHPSQGEVQCGSTKADLSRTPNDPYKNTSATTPRSPIGRGK